MALTVRLARHGRKDRPHYAIVVTDSRSPRDGKFIEKVGTYNPLLAKESDNRVTLNADRIKYWLGVGAKPTDRVATFLGKAGLAAAPAQGNNPEKAKPKAKAQERLRVRDEKLKALEEAAAEAAAAPAVVEAPAEETAPDAPAEETATAEVTEEAPATEETASEAPAEEAAAADDAGKADA
ncbi:MAG: 30S ribosomal protein S16 [Pseudomonadota bacterium]